MNPVKRFFYNIGYVIGKIENERQRGKYEKQK